MSGLTSQELHEFARDIAIDLTRALNLLHLALAEQTIDRLLADDLDCLQEIELRHLRKEELLKARTVGDQLRILCSPACAWQGDQP